jgi:hypothetical protein
MTIIVVDSRTKCKTADKITGLKDWKKFTNHCARALGITVLANAEGRKVAMKQWLWQRS